MYQITTTKTNDMTTSNETILNKLNPAIEYAKLSLLAGTLKKNVIKHFTNKGFPFEMAENIVDLGVFRAEQLSKNKVK